MERQEGEVPLAYVGFVVCIRISDTNMGYKRVDFTQNLWLLQAIVCLSPGLKEKRTHSI